MRMTNHALTIGLALLLALPAMAEDSTLAQLEMALRNASEKARKAIVSIEVSRVKDVGPAARKGGQNNKNWMQQMMRQMTKRVRRTHGAYFKRPGGKVTGFLVSSDGKVLTSYYNVAGQLDGIRVYLPGGKVLPAKLLGVDKNRDVAMLQVISKEPMEFPFLSPVATDDVKIGSFVILSSRSTGTKRTGTEWGIVSAVNRYRGTTLQIDARINYGNAGGPVVDLNGRLIGIACQLSHFNSRGQNSGVGYAASGSFLKKIMPDLAAGKVIAAPKRPFLGIQGEDANPGVKLTRVVEGTAARKAGLTVGDIVLSFNGRKLASMQTLHAVIQRCRVGQKIKLVIKRGDKTIKLSIVLGARKAGQ